MLADSGMKLPVEFHVGKTSEILAGSRICLMVSGSVSLEVMARCRPAVVLYRVGTVNWILGRLLIRCRHISLPNLIAYRRILPEYVLRTHAQEAVDKIAGDLCLWLADPRELSRIEGELAELARQTVRPGGTSRAASILISELGWQDAGQSGEELPKAAGHLRAA